MIKVKADKFYNSKELKIGTKIELEHTNSVNVAKRIAKQHLEEFPQYYSEFIKWENNMFKKYKRGK